MRHSSRESSPPTSGIQLAVTTRCTVVTIVGGLASSSPILNSGSYNLSNPQSLNRYNYVRNDPVNFVDPLGLDGIGALGGAAGNTLTPRGGVLGGAAADALNIGPGTV